MPIPLTSRLDSVAALQREGTRPLERKAATSAFAEVAPQAVRKTALSGGEAAAALQKAWTARTGEAPSAETLSILTAQWAHETGNGQSMYNYNFAGLKGSSDEGLYVVQRTKEGWGDTERTIHDRFRAYRSADEGAADYLDLLFRRYSGAVDSARAGDVQGFVRGLKSRGYFTGDERVYERSVRSLAERALAYGADALGAGGPTASADSVLAGPSLDRELPVATPAVAPTRAMGPVAWGNMLDASPVSPELAASLGLRAGPGGGVSFVALQALSEEVSRAALRIAAQPPSEDT